MPDPTRSRAYLARTKDQEKDVIAVPDGAGRALCVSFDKHWTYSREWDELHIIAPLVEEARWGQNYLDADTKALRLERQAATISELQGSFLRVERERDEAWRVAGEQTRLERDRAEAAERERDEWKARAEAAEARTAPAVTRDDIEKAIRGKVWTANRDPNKAGFHRVHIAWATDAVWSLVSGADPAIHVVRESDLPEVAAWAEDPIMVRTRELLDLASPGEYAWTGEFETCRKIAEAEARLEAGDE